MQLEESRRSGIGGEMTPSPHNTWHRRPPGRSADLLPAASSSMTSPIRRRRRVSGEICSGPVPLTAAGIPRMLARAQQHPGAVVFVTGPVPIPRKSRGQGRQTASRGDAVVDVWSKATKRAARQFDSSARPVDYTGKLTAYSLLDRVMFYITVKAPQSRIGSRR